MSKFLIACALFFSVTTGVSAQTLKYMLVNSQGVVVFRDMDISSCRAHLGDRAKDGWACVAQQ
jgi:hypothetical protein